MKRRAVRLLLGTIASLLLSGCLQGTVHERSTSFSFYSHSQLGLESTEDFLTSRTARLFSAEDLNIAPAGTNSSVFNFQTSNSTIIIGCAAAVDPRGYFLTVAHAIGQKPPWLVFGTSSGFQAKRARVVWRGQVSKGEPDLALLCVPCALGPVFKPSPHFSPGDQVLATGLDFHSARGPKLVCFAGTLKRCEFRSGNRTGSRAVFHTAPLHYGDSGGPLVDREGRLIGINVKATKEFSFSHPLGRRLNRAEHPDLSWLQQLIEKDAGTNPESRTNNLRVTALTGRGARPRNWSSAWPRSGPGGAWFLN